jgi:Mrp family chromosome partitioning ATPase
VLVIDAAGRSEAIRSLLTFSPSGDLADVVGGHLSWVEATAHVAVGRDKTIDVVTGSRPVVPTSLIELLQRDRHVLGKYYDTVLVVGLLDLVPMLAESDAVGGTVVTAIVGHTALADVIQAMSGLRDKMRQVFGVILWNGPAPRLVARPKRRTGGDRKTSTPPLVAAQPSVT